MASIDTDVNMVPAGEGSSGAGPSNTNPSSSSAKKTKRFEIKKWNAVALWAWDIVVDNCAICRNHIMDLWKVAEGGNGCVAIDHYNLFREDVKMMKKMGIDVYRFSIAWSRILPGGRLSSGLNREGVKFYNDLIDMLLEEGIEPVVTLFHFDVPKCLEDEYGGFKRIVDDYVWGRTLIGL